MLDSSDTDQDIHSDEIKEEKKSNESPAAVTTSSKMVQEMKDKFQQDKNN